MKGIRQLTILMAITGAGELMRYLIPLAVPAGIYGLFILLFLLCSGILKLHQVEGAADFLIEVMPLFFIPAGVQLMTQWTEVKKLMIPFFIAVFGITVIVMAVTGRVSQYVLRRKEGKHE